MATISSSKRWHWISRITDAWHARLRRPRQLNVDRLEWNSDPKITLSVFGLGLTAFLMMLAWAMVGPTGELAEWIARFFITANHSVSDTMTFGAMLKSFGVAVILFANLTLTIFFVIMNEPENSDVLDTMEEMDDRIMARLAEVSYEANERLDLLIRNDTWVASEPEADHVDAG
jgi:hypothetical protein